MSATTFEEIREQYCTSEPPKRDTKTMWIVEGNPELNQLNIQTVQKVLQFNLSDWAKGFNRGWVFLGWFPEYKQAQQFCLDLRDKVRDHNGKTLLNLPWTQVRGKTDAL